VKAESCVVIAAHLFSASFLECRMRTKRLCVELLLKKKKKKKDLSGDVL
jgi:hypothetical protein